jgi:DNA mismatch endonuclease (patch repair protein)
LRKLKIKYSRNVKFITGQPDFVIFPAKTIIFVHGCFWHMHRCRYGRVIPATRTEFWQNKRCGNVTRDKRNPRKLKTMGWKVLIVWECKVRNPEKLSAILKKFLKP